MRSQINVGFGQTTNVPSPPNKNPAGDAVQQMFVLLMASFVLAMVPAALWYTFDDWLAEISGVGWLGQIPFWRAYCIVWFFSWAVTRPSKVGK